MKKHFKIFFLLTGFLLHGQPHQGILLNKKNPDTIIDIPDPNFKNALVNFPVVDTTGNGLGDSVADLNGDGEIQLSEAEAVAGLIVSYYEITSLEGIQYFVNLETLKSRSNFHTTINLSQNIKLKWLHVESTPLEALDLSNNPLLERVWVYQNQLTSLDMSNNPNLQSLRVYANPLFELNIKNGNNQQMDNFLAYSNPNLNCIKVDDVEFANANPNWIKDEHTTYDEECILNASEFAIENEISIYPNPAVEILHIQTNREPYLLEVFDVSGKKVVSKWNNLKGLLVNNFEKGLYFITLYFADGTVIKPFIKE
ncbi:MAG: T9SS type A sorting domain-containing protein [Flavobacteriaceae bacterium]